MSSTRLQKKTPGTSKHDMAIEPAAVRNGP